MAGLARRPLLPFYTPATTTPPPPPLPNRGRQNDRSLDQGYPKECQDRRRCTVARKSALKEDNRACIHPHAFPLLLYIALLNGIEERGDGAIAPPRNRTAPSTLRAVRLHLQVPACQPS